MVEWHENKDYSRKRKDCGDMTELFGGLNNLDRVPDNPALYRNHHGKETETGDMILLVVPQEVVLISAPFGHIPIILRIYFSYGNLQL